MLLALTLAAPLLAGCLSDDAGPVDILTTIYPLGYLAERLAGPNLTSATMVPAGVEAHAWEPSARDIDRIARSGIFVQQGPGFEVWTGRVLRNLGADAPPVFDVMATLDPEVAPEHVFGVRHDEGASRPHDDHDGHDEHSDGNDTADAGHGDDGTGDDHDAHQGPEAHDDGHGHDGADPHTWLDPVLFAETAWLLADALAERFPAEADGIHARAAALIADFAALHDSFVATLADCGLDTIVVSHDAFGHLARRYGFQVAAISGLSPEAEPDPRTMDRLIRLVRDLGIPIVFFEETVDPSVSRTIAQEAGAETRVLSPLETLLPAQAAQGHDYMSLMRVDRDNLRDALRCP